MHVYYANGIACQELCLLVELVRKQTGQTPADMLAAVEEGDWQRSGTVARNGENKWWRKRLFTPGFSGSLYKGSAKQAQALIALLRWLAESVWMHHPQLRVAANSFLKLCACLDLLKTIPKTKSFDALAAAQRMHMDALKEAWDGYFRPKHHHALHLPRQYAQVAFAPTCWGTESKHRDYKQTYARTLQHRLGENRGGADFCLSLMPRLLTRHMELLNLNPISGKGFNLKREFTSEEVYRATHLQQRKMSTECTVDMLSLKKKIFILHGHSGCAAARINFFWKRKNSFTCSCTVAHTCAVWKWSNLILPSVPSWWRLIRDGSLLCLP